MFNEFLILISFMFCVILVLWALAFVAAFISEKLHQKKENDFFHITDSYNKMLEIEKKDLSNKKSINYQGRALNGQSNWFFKL